jgi:hypothetical protein
MNRIITALALSGMFVTGAPAFAKTVHNKSVATAGDKAAAGDKATTETKTTETKTEGSDTAAKPAKKSKKSKKVEKTTEGASSEKPAEAPAK